MFNPISKLTFYSKVLNRLSSEKNRLWQFLPVKYISTTGLGDIPDKVQFKRQIETMLGRFDANLFDYSTYDQKEYILSCANEALSHTFDLLGSGPVQINPINWHIDFKTGFEWPRKFYLKLRKKTRKGSDIKVPWELSRCHHLLWLGEAFLITGDEKYSNEIVSEIEYWINDNPFMYSVNWTCSMDVAIRSVNWMFAINMISSSKNVTDEFITKLYKSLYQHGFFIFNNLEKTFPYSNNHYASDLVGMLYLGQLFKKTKRGINWWNFSKREYYSEIRTQILPSGIQYEKSTSYHRLMTELFSYPLYMMHRIEEQIPIDIMYRIQSMYNYIAYYLKPNGNAPLVADNDDGRFLPFVKYDFRKHGYLLEKISIDNLIICCGVKPLFMIDERRTGKSSIHDDAGFSILKKKDAYLFITNGGYSKYQNPDEIIFGTHTHNDLLSFDFALGEDDVIIDPGTYCYTSSIKDRNEFRSTQKHNTIIVDEEEQNIFPKKNIFSVEKNVNINKLSFSETDQRVQCSGSYSTLNGKMRHSRTFGLSDNQLSITDIVHKNKNGHIAKLFFHFAPGIEVKVNDLTLKIDSLNYHINLLITGVKTNTVYIQDDTVSLSYGLITASQTAIIEYSFNENIETNIIIKWLKKEKLK